MPDPVIDTANPGVLRPPLVYAVSIATGVLLEAARALPAIPHGAGRPIGVGLVLLAIALFTTAVRALRAAGTPVPGNRPATALVTTGPFRFTRNPIYLAMSLLHLGVSAWVGSGWLLISLAVSVVLITAVVIPREERYMERHFGSRYLDYKASVRRWL